MFISYFIRIESVIAFWLVVSQLYYNNLSIQTVSCYLPPVHQVLYLRRENLFPTGLCFYTFNILLVLFVIAGECPQLLFLYLEIFNNLYFIYQQVVFLVNYYYDQLLYELSVRFSLVDLELSLLLPCLTNGFINYWNVFSQAFVIEF